MPYQAFRSQSRVEFIKKKFENSFPEENFVGAIKRSNDTACKTNILQELEDLNINHKTTHLKFRINDANKNEAKTPVKRSPAFRREKSVGTKSLAQVSSPEVSTFLDLKHENPNENAQGSRPNKAEAVDIDPWKNYKRSKTDINFLKHNSFRVADKKTLTKNSKSAEILNSIVTCHERKSKCDAEKKPSDQYSVVSTKKGKPDKNEVGNLQLSESIRRALQSPLPKGPPPKKPPRTFCHPSSFSQTNLLKSSISLSLPSTKFDIPKLKSKLEKLEKVMKIHEMGAVANKTNDDFAEPVKKISFEVDSSSIPHLTETFQSCLPVSQCLSQGVKVLKVPKTKSEFYFEMDIADPDSKELNNYPNYFAAPGTDRQKVYTSSPEAIYALPCLRKTNSFETFGKCIKDLKDSVNTKKEDLHYLCTDVINQTPQHPNFLSHIGERKNSEERSHSDSFDLKLNFPIVEESSSSMLSGNDPKKLKNCLREGKRNEKIKKHDCGTGEESGGESECDLIISSDLNETKKKTDPEEETLSCVTARRKIYLSRVSSKLMSQIPCGKYKNKSSYKHLFECCLLVGLTLCETKESVPYIKSIFPPNTKPPPLIESLCFPDACYWPPTSETHQPEEQCYSLVVTNENGERKFGYCRRVLPEGGNVCLPLAYCIISPHRAGGFFYKVLEELESRHGSSVVENFIKQLYESEFPGPGERLKLKEILEEATKSSQLDSDIYSSSTLVRRPPDLRLEQKDLSQLFRLLQLPVLLKVFSSLLLERKVLLLSNSLRNLSLCIEALQSILLPFSWQHTYIPVLPVHLIEMCEAPTPYVIGLLKPRNVEKSLTNVNFEDGILVDLDESKVLKCCGDEGSILPSRLIRDLKTSLNLAMNSSGFLSESVRSVLISDAFIRFFVQVCGNYSKFIHSSPNGEKVFQKEEFIQSVSSNATQSFLDWFTETAMFNSFIQERLQGNDEDMLIKLFRSRAMDYAEDGTKDSAVLLKNYRGINKKVKTLGVKIKDFTSFSK